MLISFHRPHFKPLSEMLDGEEDPSSPIKKLNSRLHGDQPAISKSHPRPRLYRSFSSQPTSKFRVNPYPTNGVCVNNQTFLSSLTSSLVRIPEGQSPNRKVSTGQPYKDDSYNVTWTKPRSDAASSLSLANQHQILRTALANNSAGASTVSNSSVVHTYSPGPLSNSQPHGQNRIVQGVNLGHSIIQSHGNNQSHNRLPSTGPSSAVYQLNFPILKNKSSSKGSLSRRQSTGNDTNREHTNRSNHKKNHHTPTKNIASTLPTTPFRQVISAAVNASPSLSVAR